mmetsp:Transcript_35524/g.79746  ORF Transcript_35524/g.79746 Transcript_35524/m.79746 type:complete len:211 (+) Transcript_35524:2055-2687(+)
MASSISRCSLLSGYTSDLIWTRSTRPTRSPCGGGSVAVPATMFESRLASFLSICELLMPGPSTLYSGNWTGSGLLPLNLALTVFIAWEKSDPSLSILLMNINAGSGSCSCLPCAARFSLLSSSPGLGRSVLRIARHTVSVWACTPATASTTNTAPSRTATERCTSTEKSTWPGVSIRFTLTDFPPLMGNTQSNPTAALCMVMPLSLSAGR